MGEHGEYSTNTDDMYAVHHALEGALQAAPELVGGATTPERVAIVASYYDNVIELLHVHHEGEDVLVYPRLEARCPEERSLLEAIDAQHRLLDEPMSLAREATSAWAAAPTTERANRLVSALETVSTTLSPHLREEESRVLPIASRYMTPEEWGELPGHAMMSFGKDKPWLGLGLVMEQATEEQRVHIVSGMPPPVQEMWVKEWSPAFNAFMGEVRA